MQANDWLVMGPRKAKAYDRPSSDGLLIREGSRAMRGGFPFVKCDSDEFSSHIAIQTCTRAIIYLAAQMSQGIVKQGNCSVPQSWRRPSDGETIKAIFG